MSAICRNVSIFDLGEVCWGCRSACWGLVSTPCVSKARHTNISATITGTPNSTPIGSPLLRHGSQCPPSKDTTTTISRVHLPPQATQYTPNYTHHPYHSSNTHSTHTYICQHLLYPNPNPIHTHNYKHSPRSNKTTHT